MEDDRFYVKTLTLENFRCFEKVTLGPFDPHFNLLVGENGSGKSSVLLALASLFRQIATVPAGIAMGPLLKEADVKYSGETPFRAPIDSDPLRIETSFRSGAKDHILRESLSAPLGSEARPLSYDIPIIALPGNKFPLLIRFTTIRQFHRTSSMRDRDDPSLLTRRWDAYVDWSNAGASADELRRWLRDETLIALEQSQARPSTAANVRAPSNALSLVRLACTEAVEGASDIAYVGARKDIIVSFLDGRKLAFTTMSDGERALVGLVAEIARRACVLNWEILGEQCLVETPGLVLIDEIDLHLHPKWQRQIIGALKRIFPKIQFFATTHSPQVIGEAMPQEIVLLTKDGKQKRPMGGYGRDSNWILECVMEAEGRNPQVADRIRAVFNAIDDDRFEEARSQIKELRKEIGDDAELVGAESYMWRIEHEADEAAE